MSRASTCLVTLAALSALAIADRPAAAQQALNSWLNTYIDSVAAARIEQNDRAKMPQLPAGTATRSSIIDRANLPDVVGISIALPTAPGADGASQPPATSLSGSPLAIVAALLAGHNPLDPSRYLSSAALRRLGFSTTWETDPTTGSSVPLVQAKVLILDRKNLLDVEGGRTRVAPALAAATRGFGRIKDDVVHILWERVGKPAGADSNTYMAGLENDANLKAALASAGVAGRKAIEEVVEQQIAAFVTVKSVVDSLGQESRRSPELAAGYTQRGSGGTHQSRGALIFDLARSVYDVTANAAYNDSNDPTIGHRASAELALQAIVRLTPDDPMSARAPLSLTLAGSGSKGTTSVDRSGVFKLQALILLPVSDGVNVPLSATWASKSSLVAEDRIVGNVGFSFDLAQIFNAIH